ncbi:hypothetical protein OIE63_34325 [Streptomyces sp. NBC_01795]|uniref:hypothetical protein n=1 Tax=unclassified Streptomyces TaxID=2593676 RepID=UPI002DDC1B53|nr:MULTISPECIES: hypothetical protein [unclassified Streptomyces]WSA96072.1 hypothetical protein OIE63_34325 [Streptomyces sp. NBC_01795]WSB80487.1 hypothetical protein OHB04_35430 [Streptomyces sp. NBC_01775]WSS11306.1 hypothetical protein OG533_04825 [Streptomyces sp. NBC_01186]
MGGPSLADSVGFAAWIDLTSFAQYVRFCFAGPASATVTEPPGPRAGLLPYRAGRGPQAGPYP